MSKKLNMSRMNGAFTILEMTVYNQGKKGGGRMNYAKHLD